MIRTDRKGSYMVEAAMSLPVFILVFTALALIVNIIASCEEMVFRQAEQVYEMDMKAPFIIPRPGSTGYQVTGFRYLYSDGMTDDLISLDSVKDFTVEDPVGIMGRITFRLGILSRAYTGSDESCETLSQQEFDDGSPSQKVIIFPKYGIRFHYKGCRYVRQDFYGEEVKLEMEKRDAELKGYTPCLVCGGG